MPAWKVFDEETASELRSRVSGQPEVITSEQRAVLDGGDAVVLAPTAHKGVVMLVTARRKSASVFDRQAEVSVEDTDTLPSAPEPSFEQPAQLALERIEAFAPVKETAPPPPEVVPTPVSEETEDEFFGPTTWERIETSEIEPGLPDPPDTVVPTVGEDETPELEQRSVSPVQVDEALSLKERATPEPVEETTSPARTKTPGRHSVATGFLGLDETTEDDEDLAREKRPWWKKLFID
jgi:hypothetical protein